MVLGVMRRSSSSSRVLLGLSLGVSLVVALSWLGLGGLESEQATELESASANETDIRRKWGKWRTPDNSNAYAGMKRPVQNTNPLGDHIISRNLDRDVNISEIEKEDNYNPLWDMMTGKGLPKMFYEDDIHAPCTDPEKCKVVRVRYASSKFHTDTSRRSARDNQRDLYVKCSDPTSPYYHPSCDPNRGRYGRPLRPGGFPDDDTVVQSRIHQEGLRNVSRYRFHHLGMGYVRFNRSHYTKYYYIDPRYAQNPVPSGVLRVPMTGTGHYGGLTGPPFLTEGPPGSEEGGYSRVRPNMNNSWHIRGLTPEEWEAIGFGDKPVDAQAIVGGKNIRDSMYNYRYVNIDQEKYQPLLEDAADDNSSDTNTSNANSTDTNSTNSTASAAAEADPAEAFLWTLPRQAFLRPQAQQHSLHIMNAAANLPSFRKGIHAAIDHRVEANSQRRRHKPMNRMMRTKVARTLDGERDDRVPDGQAKDEVPISTVADEVERVFTPVVQKNKETRSRLQATQVGLKNAAQMVKAMEAKMDLFKTRLSKGLPARFPSVYQQMEDSKAYSKLLKKDFTEAGQTFTAQRSRRSRPLPKTRSSKSGWDSIWGIFDDDSRNPVQGLGNQYAVVNPAVGPGVGGY